MNNAQLSPETMTAMREAAMLIAAVVGMWVVSDARGRGKDGVVAVFWGIATMMAMIVALPLWFLLRPKTQAPTSSTRSTPQTPAPSPFATPETARTPIPENGDAGRSKICDRCGKFYLGNFEKCPHCNAEIENK